MKKILVLTLVIFMLVGIAAAYADKSTKSSGESGWTRAYNDIANWSWSKPATSRKSDKKTSSSSGYSGSKSSCAK